MNKEKDLAKEVQASIMFVQSIVSQLRSKYKVEDGYEVLLSKECDRDNDSGSVESLPLYLNEADDHIYMGKVSGLIKQDGELRIILMISPVLISAEDVVGKFFTIALSSEYGVSLKGAEEIELFPFSDVLFAHIVDTTLLIAPLITPSQLNEIGYKLDVKYANEQVSRYKLYLINGASDESGIENCISELGIA